MNVFMKFLLPLMSLLCVLPYSFLQAGQNHIGPSYDTKPRYALDVYGEKIAKEYQMIFLLSGLGQIVGSKRGPWALHFTSQQKISLEEARPMAEKIAKGLINFIFKNPLFSRYVEESRKLYSWEPNALTINHIGYKIAFWDENVDRYLNPYLAEIRLCDGQLHYYYADPKTQALLPPVVESLPY